MKEKNLTKENKRKATILLIFGALVLLVLVAGSAYAYFRAQIGNGTSANINATTGTVDDLRFEKGTDITFRADMTNFAEGLGNVNGSSTSKAILTANDATNSAQEDYYVYVNITNNEFKYSSYTKANEQTKVFKTEAEKEDVDLTSYTARPELILTITGPDKKIVGSSTSNYQIAGLSYKENITTKVNGAEDGQTVSGYDITETSGLLKIVLKDKSRLGEDYDTANYEYSSHIEANATTHDGDENQPPYHTTQTWKVEVTFINLDTDQYLNTDKSFTGEVKLQKEKIPTSIADACVDQEMAKCITENYKLDGNIIYHNATAAQADGIANAELVAGDDSYRYSGADKDVKNYVCLDGTTTGTTCAEEDLYRIIGIFPKDETKSEYEVKLIKATPATATELGDSNAKISEEDSTPSAYSSGTNYYWNSTSGTSSSGNNVNMWKESNLNKVNLNSFYYKYMTETKGLTNKIADHTWITGGYSTSGNAKEVYDNELGTQKLTSSSQNCYTQGDTSNKRACTKEDITYPYEGMDTATQNTKIGLMYISDYMYGTSAANWNTKASSYNNDEVKNSNWLFIGKNEWTISRYSSNGYTARVVFYAGIANDNGSVYNCYAVRPVFYLSSSVKLSKGEGSKNNPFVLEGTGIVGEN